MSGRASPFAALTGAEKQLKWLEYQSIRLPYVEGSVDRTLLTELEPPPRETAVARAKEAKPVAVTDTPAEARREKPEPPKAQPGAPFPYDMQKTRHQQYDAVIARMKQAEQQAKQYQKLS